MRNSFKSWLAVLAGLLLLPCKTFASHAMGGELSYTWLHDSTYEVSFHFYRDCSGTTAPVSFTLCYYNSCVSPAVFQTAPMNLVPHTPGFTNGAEVGRWCPGVQSVCSDPLSALQGFQHYRYSCQITLSGRCSSWLLSTSVSARNSNDNTGNTGTGLPYYAAILNNLDADRNSSPSLTHAPLASTCAGALRNYNPGAVDPDGDSLYFELVDPRNGNQIDCPLSVSNVGFLPGYSATNPMSGLMDFDNGNGQMRFAPPAPGKFLLALRVTDYRNGIRVGSITRDFQQFVTPCNVGNPPAFGIDSTSLSGAVYSGGYTVTGYVNHPLSFCFDAQSAASSFLSVSDAHLSSMPAAGVSYTGQQSAAVRGCVSWSPSPGDTGLHYLPVIVTDSACPGNGSLQQYSYSLLVRILDAPPPGLGFAPHPQAAAIRVHPNPVADVLTITAPVAVNLLLSGADGRQLRPAPGASAMDLSGLPAGVYFLRITDAATGTVLKREKIIRR